MIFPLPRPARPAALQVAVDGEDLRCPAAPTRGRAAMASARSSPVVASAVAKERHTAGLDSCRDAAIEEVAVEASLLDGVERADAHAHGRELPEVREMSADAGTTTSPGLPSLPEGVELGIAEPALEEGRA